MESDRAPRRGALPTYTARRIMRDFLAQGLEPGNGLADEATLMERYGVSRGTLREALRLLTFLGAITIKAGPHGGPRLVIPTPAIVGSALGMVVQFRGARLRTIFEARLAIEPAVAALAAVNRKDADLALLDDSVALLRATQPMRGPEYAAHSGRYHLRVAEAAHNDVLAAIVPALAAMTTTVAWRYPPGGRAEMSRRIGDAVEAIRAGDSAAASTITHDMIEWIMNQLQAKQAAQMETRILWPDVDEVLSAGIRP